MRVVIVTCDRCGKEPPKRLDTGLPPTWLVSITCEPNEGHVNSYHYPQKHQQAEWCSSCVEEMQVRKPLVMTDTQQSAPTLEDIVREIVREEQQG